MSIKGYKWSEEARARQRERYKDPHNNPFFGKKHTEETKQKMSQSMTGLKHPFTPEGKASFYQKRITSEFRQEKSTCLNKLWQRDDFRDNCAIKNMKILRRVASLGSRQVCNNGEQFLFDILNELFPGEYRYNDGWFMLGRKFPDFVNVNGQKKVIELFGEKWHPIFDIAKYQEHYKQFGYSVLMVWGNQLREKDKLVKVLKRFHER